MSGREWLNDAPTLPTRDVSVAAHVGIGASSRTPPRPHADPLVSFVIPVRDDAERLTRCLESIRGNAYPGGRIEIIVVDNGSLDDSAAVAQAYGASVVRRSEGCVGELRNLGALAAHGEILAFVDADHQLADGWIAAAIDVLAQPGVGGAGDLCHAPSSGTWVQRTYDGFRTRSGQRTEVEWLGSGNMALWRHVFEALGGFDTRLRSCEDVDLCRRLRARGYRLVREPGMRNVHFGDPATLGRLFRSELWRGRDNLTVSLRRGVSWRDLPSIAVPIVDLACFAVIVAGVLVSPPNALVVALLAGAVVFGFASLRAARVIRNTRRRGLLDATRALAVAAVYDVARALALVVRPHYHRATAAPQRLGSARG